MKDNNQKINDFLSSANDDNKQANLIKLAFKNLSVKINQCETELKSLQSNLNEKQKEYFILDNQLDLLAQIILESLKEESSNE